jgi:hypothetical protein
MREASASKETLPNTPSPSVTGRTGLPSTGTARTCVVVPTASDTKMVAPSPDHRRMLALRSWVSASFRGVPPEISTT